MEFKDLFFGTLSMLAFGLSVCTYQQRKTLKTDEQRVQLTDTFRKLHDINVEDRRLHDKHLRANYPEDYAPLLNDRRRFLVRQARYLADHTAALVSPYEWALIAQGFDDIGDAPEAQKGFEHALAKIDAGFDEVMIRRQYGLFLFRRGQAARAREQYQAALCILAGDTDRERLYQGDTYERWAALEQDFGDSREVARLLQQAAAAYQHIRLQQLRAQRLERLEAGRSRFQSAPAAAADAADEPRKAAVDCCRQAEEMHEV
jgi:tetratricopeptide (TPR) repeat protein